MSLLNAYNNGVLRIEMLYVELFNLIPDIYLYYKEDLKFDTYYLTREKCIEVFGNVDVRIVDQDKIFSTSKAEEDNYDWDDNSNSFRKKDHPEVVIVHKDEKWILAIDDTTIRVFSSNFDYKGLVQNVLKWLPQQEKQSKTASIDLVAFDNHYYTITSKIKRTTIDFDTHYNDDFKEAYKNTLNFLNEQESGLIVWHGEKGSGNFTLIFW